MVNKTLDCMHTAIMRITAAEADSAPSQFDLYKLFPATNSSTPGGVLGAPFPERVGQLLTFPDLAAVRAVNLFCKDWASSTWLVALGATAVHFAQDIREAVDYARMMPDMARRNEQQEAEDGERWPYDCPYPVHIEHPPTTSDHTSATSSTAGPSRQPRVRHWHRYVHVLDHGSGASSGTFPSLTLPNRLTVAALHDHRLRKLGAIWHLWEEDHRRMWVPMCACDQCISTSLSI